MSVAFSNQKAWKGKRRQPERNLHQAVGDYLDMCLDRQFADWFPIPNGAHMGSPRHAAMMKRTKQLRPGVPDICVVTSGRAIFIELKAEHGRMSAEQELVADSLMLAGAVVRVCRSVDQVREFLGMLQVPLRGHVQ